MRCACVTARPPFGTLTGFREGNQQHRVNGLVWGLDNWLYGANGDSGGMVRSQKTGATVNIKNNDPFTHTVTSDDGSSFNVSVDGNKTATITAPTKAGTYKFHCNIHSFMHGTLTVT